MLRGLSDSRACTRTRSDRIKLFKFPRLLNSYSTSVWLAIQIQVQDPLFSTEFLVLDLACLTLSRVSAH